MKIIKYWLLNNKKNNNNIIEIGFQCLFSIDIANYYLIAEGILKFMIKNQGDRLYLQLAFNAIKEQNDISHNFCFLFKKNTIIALKFLNLAKKNNIHIP